MPGNRWSAEELARLKEFSDRGIDPAEIVRDHGGINGKSVTSIAMQRKYRGWGDPARSPITRVSLTAEQAAFRDAFLHRCGAELTGPELDRAWRHEVADKADFPHLTIDHLRNRRLELKIASDPKAHLSRPEYQESRSRVAVKVSRKLRRRGKKDRTALRLALRRDAEKIAAQHDGTPLRLCRKCGEYWPIRPQFWRKSETMCLCCRLDYGAQIAQLTRSNPSALPAFYAKQKEFLAECRKLNLRSARLEAMLKRDRMLVQCSLTPCRVCSKCRERFITSAENFRVVKAQGKRVVSTYLFAVCRYCEESFNRYRHEAKLNGWPKTRVALMMNEELQAVMNDYRDRLEQAGGGSVAAERLLLNPENATLQFPLDVEAADSEK